jgi:hypothetical protein
MAERVGFECGRVWNCMDLLGHKRKKLLMGPGGTRDVP